MVRCANTYTVNTDHKTCRVYTAVRGPLGIQKSKEMKSIIKDLIPGGSLRLSGVPIDMVENKYSIIREPVTRRV